MSGRYDTHDVFGVDAAPLAAKVISKSRVNAPVDETTETGLTVPSHAGATLPIRLVKGS
jgi:hypothetical protein